MIEENLGASIRQLRDARRLSLRSLAELSGFSAAFLSQVENGQASPSISSMQRIAHALGVSLGEFFQSTEQSESTIVRAEERTSLTSQWSHAQIEAMGPSHAGRPFECMVVRIQPDGTSGKKAYAHTHEQWVLVLEGDIVLTMGQEEHLLSRGDAVTIQAVVPRRWHNTGTQPTEILIVSAC
jgi:XRE family transcriptional regulator, regulator of sulfur utilization